MMSPYPIDSSQAVARLLALAVTVDGVPARREIALLESSGALQALTLDHDAFLDVIDALCRELRRHACEDRDGLRCLSIRQIQAMLEEIRSPSLQRALAALLLDIFEADLKLARAESVLLWEALDCWGLRLTDIVREGDGPRIREAAFRAVQA